MHNLDEFVRALYDAVPTLPDAMRAVGERTEPSHEMPDAWLGHLGRTLGRVLPSLDAGEATEAFQVVEHYVTLADDELSTGLATGLLEALADVVSSGRLPGPTLAAVLGPESRAYIDGWDPATLGRSSPEPQMRELDEFARALYGIVPTLPDTMRAAGDEVEPDHEIPICWLGDLGRALARLLPSLAPDEATEAFQVIERHLVDGSEDLRAGIATGLLEALANAVSSKRLSGQTLAAVLGPESRAYIDAWDKFTLGRSSLEPARRERRWRRPW